MAVSFAENMPMGAGLGERQERLRCFIGEFDVEVQSRCDQMKNQITALTTSIQQSFAVELIKLPKKIRNMKLSEFQGTFGGSVEAVKQLQLVQAVAQMNKMQVPAAPISTVKKQAVKRKPLGHVNNQGSDDMVTPMKRRAVAAPGSEARRTSSRLASAQSRIEPASSRKRTIQATAAHHEFITPAPRKATAKVAATPAFDPRLPKTPFIRMPKRGESILSMNGSPLAMDVKSTRIVAGPLTTVMLPMANGKAIELDPTGSLAANTKGLTKRGRKEVVGKLQTLQDQVASLMAQLAG